MQDYRSVINSVDNSTFRNMIQKTRSCLESKGINHPITLENYSESLACETAYFSQNKDFTYHTHPNGSEEPSAQDIKTTNRFNKKFMFIGLVPSNEVVVYGKWDNFSKKLGKFKV